MTRRAGARSAAGRRRAWTSGWLVGLALFFGGAVAAATDGGDRPRVAAIDWGQAQTLIALGAPPVAMAQIDAYQDWVGVPPVPDSVRELGLRVQPNMELMSQLDLDLITITPMYASSRARLEAIAPVETIDVYYHEGSAWDNTVESTRRLGALVGRADAAERLVADTRRTVETAAERVPAEAPRLLVVQFIDARHVRVYGEGSLLDDVMTRMGLDNAWTGSTTFWGFALVSLERLAEVDDARMAVLDPMPVGVAEEIDGSVLWNHLPAVRQGPVLDLPAVWSFGGLPSAARFARALADALSAPQVAGTPDS